MVVPLNDVKVAGDYPRPEVRLQPPLVRSSVEAQVGMHYLPVVIRERKLILTVEAGVTDVAQIYFD